MTDFVYLASQSPRRRQLLEQLGVRHELLLPDDEENAEALEAVEGRESPRAYVTRVTSLKLDAAFVRLKQRNLRIAPIVCADTTVARAGVIFGKPSSVRDAERMLQALSGETHRVLTAVAIQNGRRRFSALSESLVSFEAMSRSQIRRYAATGEPMGKAGAYAVQGRFAMHISRISGSYSGIMGLPLQETAHLLRAAGHRI